MEAGVDAVVSGAGLPLELPGIVGTTDAVSYTHLDVYKRQALTTQRVQKSPWAVCR